MTRVATRLTAFIAALPLLVCAALAVLLIGCGTTAPAGPNSVLLGLHKAVNTYQEQVGLAAFGGRLSPDKAGALLDRADTMRTKLVEARTLLTACGGKLPCQGYDAALRSINEQLVEAECRRNEQEAGRSGDTCKLPPKPTPGSKT